MRIVGIDPGITGAASLITSGGRSNFPTIKTVDIMTTGDGKKRRIDYRAYRDLLRGWSPDYLYFENVRAFLGQGVMAAGKFGHSIGALEAISACEVDNCVLVLPQVWKRRFGLLHTTKNESLEMVRGFFPDARYFDRVKDHNRADSALIGLYGCERAGLIELAGVEDSGEAE